MSAANFVGTTFHAPWRIHAACHGTPSAVFYPDDGERFAAIDAKAICALCPVRGACLDHAIEHSGAEGRYGVWGGMTETERRKEARNRRDRARRAGERKAS